MGDDGVNFGVDVNGGGICDMYECFIWELSLVKINVLNVVIEATCLIFFVDEIVRNS